MRSKRLLIRLKVSWPNIPHKSLPPETSCEQWKNIVRNTYLEFIHNRNNFILESLIRYLATTQVDFVSNQDNWHLRILLSESTTSVVKISHIDTKLPEVGQPVCRNAIERIRVVDRVHDTYDMCLAYLGFEVLSILRASCATVNELSLQYTRGYSRQTSGVDDIRGNILRCYFWRDGNFWDDVLNLVVWNFRRKIQIKKFRHT